MWSLKPEPRYSAAVKLILAQNLIRSAVSMHGYAGDAAGAE